MNIHAWTEEYKIWNINFPKSHGIKIFVEGNYITQKNTYKNPNTTEANDIINVIGKLGFF